LREEFVALMSLGDIFAVDKKISQRQP